MNCSSECSNSTTDNSNATTQQCGNRSSFLQMQQHNNEAIIVLSCKDNNTIMGECTI
jgi:hypothetical protein